MKTTFYFSAYTLRDDSDDEVTTPESLDGRTLTDPDSLEFSLSDFFDYEMADAGIVGGSIRAIVREGNAKVAVDYWAPPGISDTLLDRLREFTFGQMSDGAGENGFNVEVDGQKLILSVNLDEPMTSQTVDDGRPIPPASPIALAARAGDLVALRAALNSEPTAVDRTLMAWTPLHYAIDGGNFEAAELLVRAGADPNLHDRAFMWQSPLQECAWSSAFDDAASRRLVQLLLDHGADPSHVDRTGSTAKDYALLRKKPRTAELL